jgi:HEPN domain-containing protein
MKKTEQRGLVWLKQAEHNFSVCKKHLKDRFFSDACFMAEQTAQVALKAYLYFKGERFVPLHSVTALINKCLSYSKDFSSLLGKAVKLDQYYIPTRYPDVLGEEVLPFEIYKEEQAKEAYEIAKEILELVKNKIEGGKR